MLGRSMGPLCLYELLRKVQEHLGGSRACSPQKMFRILQPPLYGKLVYSECMRLVILCIRSDTVPFDFKTV